MSTVQKLTISSLVFFSVSFILVLIGIFSCSNFSLNQAHDRVLEAYRDLGVALLGAMVTIALFGLQYMIQKYIQKNSLCNLLLACIEVLKIAALCLMLIPILYMAGFAWMVSIIATISIIIDFVIYPTIINIRASKLRTEETKRIVQSKPFGIMTLVLHILFVMPLIVVDLFMNIASGFLVIAVIFTVPFIIQIIFCLTIQNKAVRYSFVFLLEFIKFLLGSYIVFIMCWFGDIVIPIAIVFVIMCVLDIIFIIKFDKDKQIKQLSTIA